jgi:hypothetical protein
MEQRGALDDGFSSMSRREIRALRREFAKLDRLGGHDHETLGHLPEQRSPSVASAPGCRACAVPSSGAVAGTDASTASALSLGDALARLRWSVVLLLLVGVLMTVATVAPTGWSGTDSVPRPVNPSTAPAAPLDPTEPGAQVDAPSPRFGTPSEAPTTPEFTFRGPFGP